ncbi:yjeF C-terminal region, hydroxyethylthiazole kinase-related [Sphingomonas sp. NFR04]|uniref:NAD(P)H-hydrate dehydratase n=1 Tax=Sphingomonas sp. NFR04 TaxID=1566283 RepID=UPI0008E3B03C|nr:NAD(P)H-hydrate dehydratase [Sphingomonas sp. NFR04]SFI89851.1 yjeF C-terminal region, hydroxyethylthiazole kinase-related [Sphingomonas sp. NFR04]
MIALDRAWLAANPLPPCDVATDKNARGRVLVAGGSERVPGALRLTGEAALRTGAGKVQLATVERAALALGVAMPEAALFGLPANGAGELGSEAGHALAALLERCDALVLGPGMGIDADAAPLLDAILAGGGDGIALLLDAAILAVVSSRPEAIIARSGATVLTPHPGEMAKMMDEDPERIVREAAAVACEAAARFGAVVALKGPETYVATPEGIVLHYTGGGPGLATGGSGDVLAGAIGGLLARGAAPLVAIGWGVWLHGEAGRRLAERMGTIGFLGRELAPEIPALMESV